MGKNNACRKQREIKKVNSLQSKLNEMRRLEGTNKYDPNITYIDVWFINDNFQGFIDFIKKDKKRLLNLEKAKYKYIDLMISRSRFKILKEKRNEKCN